MNKFLLDKLIVLSSKKYKKDLVMWQRRTFHACAEELSVISEDFRAAYTNKFGWERSKREQILADTSKRGVEVLRILALSIRGDQDFDLTVKDSPPVGAIKRNATQDEVLSVIHNYRPPYSQLSQYNPLTLRQALNKIAHTDPTRNGFYANSDTHDLILSGINQGNFWVAIISLVDLCRVIKSLPDVSVQK